MLRPENRPSSTLEASFSSITYSSVCSILNTNFRLEFLGFAISTGEKPSPRIEFLDFVISQGKDQGKLKRIQMDFVHTGGQNHLTYKGESQTKNVHLPKGSIPKILSSNEETNY